MPKQILIVFHVNKYSSKSRNSSCLIELNLGLIEFPKKENDWPNDLK